MAGHRPMSVDEIRQTRDLLNLHEAYADVFSGEKGGLVLADLERRGFVNDLSYSPEPGRTQFNEGRRSLVLHINHMRSDRAREALLKSLQPEISEGD